MIADFGGVALAEFQPSEMVNLMNQVQRIWVVAFLCVSGIAGNAFSNESGFLSWLSSSPMSAQAGTVEDASPIPVEESQIYWAGLLYDEAGAIVQIQNGDFNFIDFDPDSEPAENKALVFGADWTASTRTGIA